MRQSPHEKLQGPFRGVLKARRISVAISSSLLLTPLDCSRPGPSATMFRSRKPVNDPLDVSHHNPVDPSLNGSPCRISESSGKTPTPSPPATRPPSTLQPVAEASPPTKVTVAEPPPPGMQV